MLQRLVLLTFAIAATVLGAAGSASGAPRCDPAGSDLAAVTAARADVDRSCDCAAATSPASYYRCARGVADRRIADGSLPGQCVGALRSWAKRSTCGRPGKVACCVRSPYGPWGARLRNADACVAPRGGASCTMSGPHLEQGCLPDVGCPWSVCGDGAVDFAGGEECEPPGAGTCDASCHYVHTCGNGIVELGEECDGQAVCDGSCRLARSLCCQLGEYCFADKAHDVFDVYFFSKGCSYTLRGTTSYGICEGTQPCPDAPPGLDCKLGTCGDAPIDPVPLCCQQVDGTCSEQVATTTSDVSGCSTFPPPDHGDVARLIVGTCGGDGRCVPLGSGSTP